MKGPRASSNPTGQPSAATLLQRGMSAWRVGRLADAVRDLTAAAGSAQDTSTRFMALKAMGAVLGQAHRHAAALDALRQAEALNRDDAQVARDIAVSLRSLDRHAESVEACKRARRLNPEDGGMAALLMDNLVRLRRDEEAEALMREVDRLGLVLPEVDHAYTSVALRHKRFEEAISRLLRHASNPALPSDMAARVHYGLGDLYDAAGRYDEAWAAYVKGNDLRGGSFDPDRWATSIEITTRLWTADLIRRLQEGASDDRTPVLVVGMPRSGTTLTDATLGRHPKIHMGGELGTLGAVIVDVSRVLGKAADVHPDEITPAQIAQAARTYSGAMAQIGMGADRVTNKMPMNIAALGFFAAMFPGGAIVHCRRDPRDVCLSCYFRNFQFPNPFTNNPQWLAAYHRGYTALVRHWGRTFAQLDRAPRLHEVRYEQLVAEPEAQARALIDAVGMPWDAACGDLSAPQGNIVTLRADQVGKAVYTSSKGRHTNYTRHIGMWADLQDPSFWDLVNPA